MKEQQSRSSEVERRKEPTDKQIVNKIVEGIQNKKGHRIVIVDLKKLSDAPCQYFVIAEGNSSTQIAAIADEVEDFVRKELGIKPFAIDIFQREPRAFYDIENLWEDGKITEIPEA